MTLFQFFDLTANFHESTIIVDLNALQKNNFDYKKIFNLPEEGITFESFFQETINRIKVIYSTNDHLLLFIN
jgi:hypothetical protein